MNFTGSQFRVKYCVYTSMWFMTLHPVTQNIDSYGRINSKLKEDLVIINERGLVGKIVSATNSNSKVMLINDQNSSVPVKTIMNNVNAIISGTTDGKFIKSSFIQDEKKFKVGDLLLTSGNAKIFPKDILVGRVIKVDENSLIALPYVDFDNLDLIQVIDTN